MRKILLIVILISIQSGSFCQVSLFHSDVEKATPFPGTQVTLSSSWIKNRGDLNTQYLKSLDPDRLLHNFRINAGLPSEAKPLEGWESPNIGLRGHFVGHYLSAVSSVVERYKDPELTKRLNYLIDELYKCQQALGNGYLSAFPEKEFDILETRFGGVWAPYYTYHKIMQGLLDVYTRTGNKKAYEMVVKMAAYVGNRMSKLDDETIEKVLYSVGANPANEAGAMNEVLYKLYEISKDPKHLALAKIFDPRRTKNLDFAAYTAYPNGETDNIGNLGFRLGNPNVILFASEYYKSVGGVSGVMEIQPGPVNWGSYNPLLLPGTVRMWLYHTFAAGGKLACSYRFRQILYSSEQYHSGVIQTDGVTPSQGGRDYMQFMKEIKELRKDYKPGQG